MNMEEQINGFLRRRSEVPTNGLCRQQGFSDAAFYGCPAKYGGVQVNDTKRVKALEATNAKLNKPLAVALQFGLAAMRRLGISRRMQRACCSNRPDSDPAASTRTTSYGLPSTLIVSGSS